MAFPPPTIQTNVTDVTDQAGLHPDLHNKLAAGVNDITAEVVRVNGDLVGLANGVNVIEGRVTVVEGRVTAVEGRVTTVENTVADLANDAQRLGAMRGRTNIDTVTDGGAIRYTVDLGTYGVVDSGDGSGYLVPTGVYGVAASAIQDVGDDMICYIQVGGRPVQPGSRAAGDVATYATWVGQVLDGEQIHVRVQMPTQRAVVGGRLEIWRLAEST